MNLPNPTLTEFYRCLFEPGERVGWSPNIYDIDVRPLRWISTNEQFFVINPLRDGRKEEHVTAYRNILVEFDKLELDKQRAFLEEMRMPYSTLVYSGGKSMHAIISLEWPCTTLREYKALVKRVYKKLGANVDKQNSNSNRYSRAPEAIRDNGKEQTLLEVWGRIPLPELLQWLGPAPVEPLALPQYRSTSRMLTVRVQAFLRYGAPAGKWNLRLYGAACDMFRYGHSLAEVRDLLSQVTGRLDGKDLRTIASAARSINSLTAE